MLINAVAPPEIAVLFTNFRIAENVKYLLRIIMCALVSNESAVSDFNDDLRIYSEHHLISYASLE